MQEEIEAKRETAARARRVLAQLSRAEDRERLKRHADELDAQADELEREMRDQKRLHDARSPTSKEGPPPAGLSRNRSK
jgi:hypothetical protein